MPAESTGGISIPGQQLGADNQDVRPGIDAIIGALHSDYKSRNLISAQFAFSGMATTGYHLFLAPGLALYTAPSLTLPRNGFPDSVSPLPGVEVAQFDVPGIAGHVQNVWYRDRVTMGADNNGIGCNQVLLDYSFLSWLGPADPGVAHEPDNGVKLWLCCYKFLSSVGQKDLPLSQNYHQDNAPWANGSINHQDGWDSLGYPNTVYFDNRVNMGNFFPPGDMNANGNIYVTIQAEFRGQTGNCSVKIINSTFTRSCQFFLPQVGAAQARGICDVDFQMFCGEQYYIEASAQVSAMGWWEPHYIGVGAGAYNDPPPPPAPPSTPAGPEPVYPDKKGWAADWSNY